jgi:hypothetical protein
MAATRLVCTSCGASFLLDHKYDGSGDELFAWGGPVNWVPTAYERLFRHAPGTPELHAIETDHEFRPKRDNEKLARLQGLTDELSLADYRCPYCDQRGALTREWGSKNQRCPRCKADGIELVGSYIT